MDRYAALSAKTRRILIFLLLAISSPAVTALTLLNVSDNAVEVVPGVQPNIMILNDDSGSMDAEVFTLDANNDGMFTGTQPNGTNPAGSGAIKGRAGCSIDHAFGIFSFKGYVYGVKFDSNYYPLASSGDTSCYVAADHEWRFRNHDFNPLYFDPNRGYEPWAGLKSDGTAFGDISITNAPDRPYAPTQYINLTTQISMRQTDGIGFRFTLGKTRTTTSSSTTARRQSIASRQ